MPNIISAKYLRPILFLLQNILILIEKFQKVLFFTKKRLILITIFQKLLLVSDECFVLNLNPYCIILRYSAPWEN